MLHKILPYLDLFGQTMSLKYFHEVDIFWSIMIFKKYQLQFWFLKTPYDELNCEEYDNKVVNHLNYEDDPRELNIARGILFVMWV